MFIGGEVRGHQEDNLYLGYPYEGHTDLVPDSGNGASMNTLLVSRGYPSGESYTSIEDLLDGEVTGNQGGSLDGFTPVSYRGNTPGFGGYNDQPLQSGPTNMGGKAVGSQEAGTGKPWGPVAHMPVAEGVNPTRSSYAYQGMFMDGQQPILNGFQITRLRDTRRAAAWTDALFSQQQNPRNKMLSQWVGSTIMEVPSTMSLSEALGRFTDDHGPSWGIQ